MAVHAPGIQIITARVHYPLVSSVLPAILYSLQTQIHFDPLTVAIFQNFCGTKFLLEISYPSFHRTLAKVNQNIPHHPRLQLYTIARETIF